MTVPSLRIVADPADLADAVAIALIDVLIDIQSQGRVPSVVLTGGGVGVAALAAVRDHVDSAAIDWSRVDIWWGDERYLPAGDPERNETQARAALLDHVSVDPTRVHAMPAAPVAASDVAASDVAASDVAADDAAEDYAQVMASHAVDAEGVPRFDLLMLGMGPEGHIASLFPQSPGVQASSTVVAVRDCPKPPPTRISLTLGAIQSARQVWLIAAGEAKAAAIAQSMNPTTNPCDVPAAGARGTESTCYWVDRAAAALID